MCSEGSTLIRSMSNSKRLSQSSWRERIPLPSSFISVSDDDAQEWLTKWRTVFARGMQLIFMPFYHDAHADGQISLILGWYR